MTTSSAAESAPDSADVPHYSLGAAPKVWWDAHFESAASQVLDFLAGDNISLAGKRVADVGCGDGITDLGLVLRGRPERLVGFDLLTTDVDDLARLAKEHADIDELPDNLFFASSEERRIPAADHSFDVVVSWSAFEHIADPAAVLREIRRVLTHHGVLFIQLWPFFDAAHGTHLVDWFPEGFAQHRYTEDEILARVRSRGDQELGARLIDIYQTLNKITLDDLGAALRETGFRVAKIALDAEEVHLPEEVAHLPLSQVAVSGVKLLAIPPVADRPEDLASAQQPEPAGERLHQLDAAPLPPRQDETPAPPTFPVRAVRAARAGLSKADEVLRRYDK
jgi:SAM-dependent methyltransferase